MSLKDIVGKGSWRTSLVGWLGLIAAVALQLVAVLDSDPSTTISMEAILTALASVGLIAARDNKVTSEESGASRDP